MDGRNAEEGGAGGSNSFVNPGPEILNPEAEQGRWKQGVAMAVGISVGGGAAVLGVVLALAKRRLGAGKTAEGKEVEVCGTAVKGEYAFEKEGASEEGEMA